jgi:acetate kinase
VAIKAMKILVLNSGSATVKFQVIEIVGALHERSSQRKLARGLVDRIGAAASFRVEVHGLPETSAAVHATDHEQAVRLIVDRLRGNGVGQNLDGVGHRVVHGGEIFTSSMLIDDAVLRQIDALSDLAPLHNPPAVSGIRAARKVFGDTTPMVAVFDTVFHRFLPEAAATYAIPQELSEKYRIRRYGFHGLAHQYSLLRYAELAAVSADTANLVTLHLGNGCSAAAIQAGRSIDTSMGFTPLEGLIMGTRSGDLDPALINYLARKEALSIDAIEKLLNKQSGLLGLSGRSQDMRDLSAVYDADQCARLAIDAFCYRARKYLGAYLLVIGGADAVIFSGGIGENAPFVREKICANMAWCGLQLESGRNRSASGEDRCISTDDSRIAVYVVHTDEEGIIARETARLCVK